MIEIIKGAKGVVNIKMPCGESACIGVNVSGLPVQSGDYAEYKIYREKDQSLLLYKKVSEITDGSMVVELKPEDTEQIAPGNYSHILRLWWSGHQSTLIPVSDFTLTGVGPDAN
ncbi:hypothetical protein [Candidatus Allofournierella merdipullorum]|uniref:hypothetical protein n=1 Tax=Candidatus Allofournierella merdipullorum TaxID=2838595 RepID=UPI002A8A7352|nr:hypothetical protein [Candidatus Fournierella merdipullorum]